MDKKQHGQLLPMDQPSTAALPDNASARLQTLYDAGLYRQAYDLGTSLWGQLASWPTPGLKLQGARTLAQLGLHRQSAAWMIRLSRKHPALPGLAAQYVRVCHHHRGPLVALEELTKARASDGLLPSDRDDLLLEEAGVLSAYRDFAAAERCLAQVAEPTLWCDLLRIDLKIAEDAYPEALELALALMRKEPRFLAGCRRTARLLQLLGRPLEAIAQLEPLWQTSESWWLGQQLFSLLVEQQSYPQAEACLERLTQLPPRSAREVTRPLNEMRADLLCAQGQYQAALPFLEIQTFYHARVKEAIHQARSESVKHLLEVPFVRQANMTCAPASLTAVARYFGREQDQADIIEAICYGGTQSYDERRWAESEGFYCAEFTLNFADAKSLLDDGIPLLLNTVEPGSAHLQVMVGYDETKGTYFVRDPYYPRLQEFLISECESFYAASGPRCMAMVPADARAKLVTRELRQRHAYDLLYQLHKALKHNDRDTALACLNTLSTRPDAERLMHVAERSLALYDRDDARLLQATEALLARYPNDINFQLSKAATLKDLGSTAAALAYLRTLAEPAHSHFLLRSRLANELRQDHRHAEHASKLYRQLLRARPLHAPTLYGYAGLLWDQQQYGQSYQLYRFCACLEDTTERFSESYFKAAVYHKQTEVALAFLRERFARFGRHNAGPAMSLYRALDLADRQHEAMSLLDDALALRPDDAELVLFAA